MQNGTCQKETDGANVILDIVGGDYVARNVDAASVDGRILQLAFNKGSKIEIDLRPIQRKRLILTGSTLRARTDSYKATIARQLMESVWPKIEAGLIRPRVFKTFPLSQAVDAHRLMESATHFGKIILTP